MPQFMFCSHGSKSFSKNLLPGSQKCGREELQTNKQKTVACLLRSSKQTNKKQWLVYFKNQLFKIKQNQAKQKNRNICSVH